MKLIDCGARLLLHFIRDNRSQPLLGIASQAYVCCNIKMVALALLGL